MTPEYVPVIAAVVALVVAAIFYFASSISSNKDRP